MAHPRSLGLLSIELFLTSKTEDLLATVPHRIIDAQAAGAMTDIMLCPYCVDSGQSMPMSARSDGNWFVCDRCGHLMLSHNPMYKCTCARCAQTVQGPKIQR